MNAERFQGNDPRETRVNSHILHVAFPLLHVYLRAACPVGRELVDLQSCEPDRL